MAVYPPSAERMAQVTAILAEEYRDAVAASAPEHANLENALHLVEPEVLHFRDRSFLVEPISALNGLRLMQLSAELQSVAEAAGSPDGFRRFARAYWKILGLLARLARPRGWRGLLWRLRPNPFRSATQKEVEAIVGFFARYQTRSSVRYRGQEPTAGRPRSTIRN